MAADPQVTVRVEGISKKFGNFQALSDVSFELKKGEILGFLGPNGAGKTTTVRILTGFFPPSSGKVWIGDRELFKDPRAAKKKIGYLPESVSVYGDMRVTEFLEFVAALKSVPRSQRREHIEDKLTRCGLWDVRKRLIGNLSKGFKQRTGIAQALIGDPEVVVLDEPTNGLDPKQIIEIRALIREVGRERTLILSTHILPEVSMVCDRVLIMNKGRIVASGTTQELEAGLKKAHEIFVVVGGGGISGRALELLKSLAGVERVQIVEEKDAQVEFAIVATGDEDLRPAISRIFVEQKIPLLEIRAGRLSLEEIFLRIVAGESQHGPGGETP